jgi:uroporphyrinogen-III synthase
MRVLITRPGDDSASLADALRRIGIDPVFEPLLTIRFFDGPPLDLAGAQAILLTSANGARAIARRTERRDVPVYAVGDATARTARELGFSEVQSASGDAEALATLVRARLDPAQGSLLHAAASEVAGDLGSRLSEAGFTFRREVLYEAEAAHSLTPSTVAAIKEGRLGAATVFSPRTAETLGRLIRKARLVRDCRTIELLCLSPAVAEAAGDIPWKAVRVAEQPTQDSLVALAGSLTETVPAANGNAADGAASASAPPPARAAHPVRAVFMTLLVIAALAGLAAVTESLWRAPLGRYVPILASDEDVAQARIDELTRRLAALESKPPPAPAPAPASPDVAALQAERDRLQARLAETVARLDKLEAALNSKPSAPAPDPEAALRIERLARQVDALEKSVPPRHEAEAVRQAHLVFAIGRLRDAVQATRPFAVELAALKALAGGDAGIQEALARLAPYADTGVPSLEALRQRFKTVARDTVNATRLPGGDGWLERSLARILRSVSIRRTDDVEGGDVESVVARAEQALARGDVRQAAAELQQLPLPVAPLARTWLGDADAFIVANRALVDLQTQAFVTLGVPGPR